MTRPLDGLFFCSRLTAREQFARKSSTGEVSHEPVRETERVRRAYICDQSVPLSTFPIISINMLVAPALVSTMVSPGCSIIEHCISIGWSPLALGSSGIVLFLPLCCPMTSVAAVIGTNATMILVISAGLSVFSGSTSGEVDEPSYSSKNAPASSGCFGTMRLRI